MVPSPTSPPAESARLPEPGQFVEVRRRYWQVSDVHPSAVERRRSCHHKVLLESVDPHSSGERLEVIWEREVHVRVFDELPLPRPDGTNLVPIGRFEAFLLAVRWSTGADLTSCVPPFSLANLGERRMRPRDREARFWPRKLADIG
jgi:hypothetical protein